MREGEGAQSGPGDTSGWDFDNLATAGVAFDWRRTRLTLIYAPRLVFTDFTQSDASSDLMHGADLALTFQGRSTTLVLSQHGEYGHRRFTALARADVDAITGRFAGLQNGSTVALDGYFATISYEGDLATLDVMNGNDVVLYNFVPVPEPAGVLMVAAAAAACGFAGRRWRRPAKPRAAPPPSEGPA